LLFAEARKLVWFGKKHLEGGGAEAGLTAGVQEVVREVENDETGHGVEQSGRDHRQPDHTRHRSLTNYTKPGFQAGLRIRIGTGFNWVNGSGSRRSKMTHKSRKKLKISCFEVLDGLF
jgi:hypothetical protein